MQPTFFPDYQDSTLIFMSYAVVNRPFEPSSSCVASEVLVNAAVDRYNSQLCFEMTFNVFSRNYHQGEQNRMLTRMAYERHGINLPPLPRATPRELIACQPPCSSVA